MFLRIVTMCFGILIVLCKVVGAQPFGVSEDSLSTTAEPKPKINSKRLYLVSGVVGGGLVGAYAAHIKPWWTGETGDFHVTYDWFDNYWLEMDKIGHFYANNQLNRLSAEVFEWTGVTRRSALWIGFLSTTAFYTAVEVTDGRFERWGFSVPDYVYNVAGAGYPVAQEYWKPLRHFNFKISYWPSKFYREETVDDPGFESYEPYDFVIEDYDGMTFWLSADLDWMLPGSAKPYWPDWLNLALGYTAFNLPQSNHGIKERRWLIGLDYNTNLLPGDSRLMNTFRGFLSGLHLPAPAIEFREDGSVFYLLYF